MVDPDPCLIAVAAADALEWAEGRLDDVDLILRAPLVPECIFILNLPNLTSYRRIVRQALYWKRRGAVCLITRTFNCTVDDHLLKFGGIPSYRERYRGVDT